MNCSLLQCLSKEVRQSSHHKDPRALALYQHRDPAVRLSTSFAISKAVAEAGSEEDNGPDEIVEEEEDNAFIEAWRVGQRRARSD